MFDVLEDNKGVLLGFSGALLFSLFMIWLREDTFIFIHTIFGIAFLWLLVRKIYVFSSDPLTDQLLYCLCLGLSFFFMVAPIFQGIAELSLMLEIMESGSKLIYGGSALIGGLVFFVRMLNIALRED